MLIVRRADLKLGITVVFFPPLGQVPFSSGRTLGSSAPEEQQYYRSQVYKRTWEASHMINSLKYFRF